MDIFDYFTPAVWVGYVVLMVLPCLYIALWIEYMTSMLRSEWRDAFKVYAKGNYSPIVNLIEANKHFSWTIIWPVLILFFAFGAGVDDVAKPAGLNREDYKDYFIKHGVIWFLIGMALLEVFFSLPIKRIIKEQKLAKEQEQKGTSE